jgi:hypothetical protein
MHESDSDTTSSYKATYGHWQDEQRPSQSGIDPGPGSWWIDQDLLPQHSKHHGGGGGGGGGGGPDSVRARDRLGIGIGQLPLTIGPDSWKLPGQVSLTRMNSTLVLPHRPRAGTVESAHCRALPRPRAGSEEGLEGRLKLTPVQPAGRLMNLTRTSLGQDRGGGRAAAKGCLSFNLFQVQVTLSSDVRRWQDRHRHTSTAIRWSCHGWSCHHRPAGPATAGPSTTILPPPQQVDE